MLMLDMVVEAMCVRECLGSVHDANSAMLDQHAHSAPPAPDHLILSDFIQPLNRLPA